MTPYARCSTRLSRARDAENLAWTRERCETCEGKGLGMVMVCHGGQPHETTGDCPDCRGLGWVPRRDPRAAGKAAHERVAEAQSAAVDYTRALIEEAVRRFAERFRLRDQAARLAAALAASRMTGTSLFRRARARG